VPARTALRFDTEVRTLRTVRRYVRDAVLAYGGSSDDAVAVETATGEALINAYEHAYGRRSGPIEIDVRYDEAKIEITIHDDGEPILDAPAIPDAPPSGERGRGLYLMGQLVDECQVIHPWHDRRGVGIRLVKYLRRSSPSPAPPPSSA
jgi:anti-sigma regulatory factor (Ser/Thr protein kinase)